MNIIVLLRKSFSAKVLLLTAIAFIFVLRKTVFNVARDVGDYSYSVDSTTSLALLGIALGSLLLIGNWKKVRRMNSKVRGYMLYYVLAFLSILWAGSAGTIVFKGAEVVVNFYLCCLIVYIIGDKRLSLLYAIFFCTAVSACDFLWTIASLGLHAMHTNSYTMSAMIGLLLALGCAKFKVFSYGQMFWFVVANAVFIIMGTSSATYISTIIGLLFLYVATRRGVNIVGVAIAAIVLYAIYEYFYYEIIAILFHGRTMDSIETGTGRSFIWEACFNSWKETPFLGKGFIVGERNLANYGLGHNALSAHNSFMSALVNTGLVGLFIFVRFLFIWFRKVYIASRRNIYATILIPVMVATIVNCNACPALATDWGYVASCAYLLMAISFL